MSTMTFDLDRRSTRFTPQATPACRRAPRRVAPGAPDARRFDPHLTPRRTTEGDDEIALPAFPDDDTALVPVSVSRSPSLPADQPRRIVGLRRSLAVALIAAGALLQHAIVTAPPESTPTPLHIAAVPASMPAPAPAAGGQGVRLAAPVQGGGGAGRVAIARVHSPLLVVPRPGAVTPQGLSHAQVFSAAPAVPVVSGASAGGAALGDSALTRSIARAFASYALPYQANSALIVAVGRQFGVDPAIPAALFMHEDGNINNRSLFPAHMNWLLYHTHNPGNIKCMYDPCYSGFQIYPTYRDGILDWFRLYDHYYFDLGIHDLARFVATYCPPNVDGNGPPSGYQSDVEQISTRIRLG